MKLIITCTNNYKAGRTGIYARVSPVRNEAYKNLVAQLEANAPCPFNEIYDDPHVTVMYSRSVPTIAQSEFVHGAWEGKKFEARSASLVYWPGYDNKGVIVLRILSPDLSKAHESFLRIGAMPTFRPYVPHMTIVKHCGPQTPEMKAWIHQLNIELGLKPVVLTFKSFLIEAVKS